MDGALAGFLAPFEDSRTWRVAAESAALTRSILPGLIAGLAASSALAASRPWEWTAGRRLSGGFAAIAMMAALGVVSPFCSYLAIPLAAGLIAGGAPAGPVFAFLCATPLMNPTLFAMTWSVFGPGMALARTVAALGFGIAAGCAAAHCPSSILDGIQRRAGAARPPRDSGAPFVRRWLAACLHMGRFAVKYVMLGVIVAALVKELVPMAWVERATGRGGGRGVLTGALLGVPLYACGGGTIPLIEVLTNMGMSHGAALAFFIAGPATKAPNLIALRAVAGWRAMATYAAAGIVWAIAAGWLYTFAE